MYRRGDVVRVVSYGSPLHNFQIGTTGKIVSFSGSGNPWVKAEGGRVQIVHIRQLEFIERTKYEEGDLINVLDSLGTAFSAGDICKVTQVESSDWLKAERLTDNLFQIISPSNIIPNDFRAVDPVIVEDSDTHEGVSSMLTDSTVYIATSTTDSTINTIEVTDSNSWQTYSPYTKAVEEVKEEEFVYIRCLGDRPNGDDDKFAEFQSHATLTLSDNSSMDWEKTRIVVKKDTQITWLYIEDNVDFFVFKYHSSSCIVKGKINSGKAKINT